MAKEFKSAKDQKKLLEYLFGRRGNPPYAKDIEADVYKRDPSHSLHNPGHARERIGEFKLRLETYASRNPTEKWHCNLPGAEDKDGYRLQFLLRQTLVEQLWEPHFTSGKFISVVCDPLLFFYDHAEGRMLRFVDTNIEGLNRERATDELQLKHPGKTPEKLIAGHFYVDVGALLASERLREYFWNFKQVRVPLVFDKDGVGQDWTKGSPVLLGTARTNTFIRRILGAPETKALRYRLHLEKFAWVTIDRPSDSDVSRLLALGPIIEWNKENTSFTTTSPEFTIGIVSRFKDPRGGSGFITLITSDATRNTTQLAEALTDDKQFGGICEQMGIKNLPESFEMLFLVKLWPGDLDDEAGEAQLIGWHALD